MVRRMAVMLSAVIALAGLGVLVPAGAANADTVPTPKAHVIKIVVHPDGTCSQAFNPSTDGGEAAWTLTCGSGNITIDGWVKDTAADGKCAYVKAFDGAGNRWPGSDPKACPSGTKKFFNWTAYGQSVINAYLYVT